MRPTNVGKYCHVVRVSKYTKQHACTQSLLLANNGYIHLVSFSAFLSPPHQAHRSTTMLPNISETGDVRRDSRSATVAMATGGGATGEQDPVDDVVEYEEGFKMVEKYNIISVSGNGYYTGVIRMQMQHSRNVLRISENQAKHSVKLQYLCRCFDTHAVHCSSSNYGAWTNRNIKRGRIEIWSVDE